MMAKIAAQGCNISAVQLHAPTSAHRPSTKIYKKYVFLYSTNTNSAH